MQGTGWVPITPIDITLPYWPGLWLGVYPTVETIGAQIAAAAFVIGSYFLAQEMKVKRPRRRVRKQRGRAGRGRRRAGTRAGQPVGPLRAAGAAWYERLRMDELAVGSTFAEHVIRGVAGRGGMGVVYRAAVPLGREVALKVIAPELSQDHEFRIRFQREFRAAASIQHPNVIPSTTRARRTGCCT